MFDNQQMIIKVMVCLAVSVFSCHLISVANFVILLPVHCSIELWRIFIIKSIPLYSLSLPIQI